MKLLLLLGAAASINYLIPIQYQANPAHPVPVVFVEPAEVSQYCGKSPQGYFILACEKAGTLIMPNPCEYPEYKNVDSYARLLCHEKAHVNGWVHD